jgi:opacity protein-like surface antigen
MKKIISSITVSLLLISSANAQNTTYLSLKYANGSGTETLDYSTGYSREGKFDMSEISLGVGLQSKSNKIELNYNVMNTDGYDFKSYGIDYIKSINNLSFDIGKLKIKPELDMGLKYYKEIHNSNGIGIKLGIGVSSEISKAFEVGVGYEYQYVAWENFEGYYTNIDISDSIFDFKLFGRFKF